MEKELETESEPWGNNTWNLAYKQNSTNIHSTK